jgi:hypothetical protein
MIGRSRPLPQPDFAGAGHELAAHRACGIRLQGRSGQRWPQLSVPKGDPYMLLIREVMYCKPGKVRPLVEKFAAMNKLGQKMGMPKMRVLTDFSAERYWTLVSEMEVPNLEAFEKFMSGAGQKESDMKEFETIMKGYHDLVDHGRREIYKIEA